MPWNCQFLHQLLLLVRVLRGVWELADIDGDGALDADEFAVALYLCRQAQAGAPLPTKLPADWVPPSKRTANPF